MKTEIVKIAGKWKVRFSHGVQGFTLDYSGTKKEAEWMKSMLDKCFEKAGIKIE